MDSLTDQQLLRDYADSRSEAAFAELVRRHVDFIHSAAVRMVCDAHLAEDVTQRVFVALAQNARQLAKHPVLAGWLHRAAQNIAAQTIRTDVRRRGREQEAVAMNEPPTTEADLTWQQVAPHLDAALGELDPGERDVVLLRYFHQKSAAEIAQSLGISPDAAQKRVSRAVERLREFLSKRGIAVGAGGLVAVVSANAVQAAPAGLAAAISATAGIAVTALATTTIAKTIAMTTIQKTLITAVIAAAIGVAAYETRQASTLRGQIRSLQDQQAGQLQQLEQEHQREKSQLAARMEESARTKSGSSLPELLKLRSEVGRLRRQSASGNADTNTAAKMMAQLMDSTKEYARGQTEQAAKSKYAPLTRQLTLSPEMTDKFINLVVDSEMNKKDMLARLLSGDLDVQTALQNRGAAGADLQNQLTALLGDSGYAQFDQFNRDTAATRVMKELNQALGDNALNDAQSQQMQVLFEAKPDIAVDDMDLFRSKESLDAIYQTVVDRSQSDLQKAASFLTPQQLAAASVIQSNYFITIRKEMTTGQQLIQNVMK